MAVAVGDVVTGGDGTWSASGGQLQNDTVVAVSGAPNSGNGSLVLIDGPYYQDIQLSADIILSGSADNGGLVFGYLDKKYLEFWGKNLGELTELLNKTCDV